MRALLAILVWLWLAVVWGGWWYAVMVMDRSAWWTLLALALSSMHVKSTRSDE
jgi:hypothetical protein